MNKKKLYDILNTIIVIITVFLLSYLLSFSKSFWFDELDWTISYLDKSNIFNMISSLSKSAYNMPLFYIIYFPLYKLLPYGEFYLLLPNICAIIIGIFILKKIGEKVHSIKYGLIIQLLLLTSPVIYYCALELRPYAFLFCLSSYTLLKFINRFEISSKRNIILYTISLILLSYTHYFGCLIIVFYFICDFFYFIRHKYKLTVFIPYIITGILLLPWFLFVFKASLYSYYSWTVSPMLIDIMNSFNNLLSYNNYSKFIFLLSIISIIFYKKRKEYKYRYICTGSIFFVIFIIFIYSKYVNPRLSLFVTRYFIVILPHIFVVSAIFPTMLLNIKFNQQKNTKNTIIRFLILIVSIFILAEIIYNNYRNFYNNYVFYSDYKLYKKTSNTIQLKEKTFTGKSLLLENKMGTGFLIYYFEKKGEDFPDDVYTIYNNDFIQFVKNKKRINKREYVKNINLKEYDTIYLYLKEYNTKNESIQSIDKNFKLVDYDNELKLYIYRKII